MLSLERTHSAIWKVELDLAGQGSELSRGRRYSTAAFCRGCGRGEYGYGLYALAAADTDWDGDANGMECR